MYLCIWKVWEYRLIIKFTEKNKNLAHLLREYRQK